MTRAMMVKTNDMHLVIYLSSLIRSIIALHDLVNNKIMFKEKEQGENEPPKTKKDDTVDDSTTKDSKSSQKNETGNASGEDGNKQ